jgi:flavin reductase (DIM6/NTAB) family NADH-FMN oxidoreductase RutF
LAISVARSVSQPRCYRYGPFKHVETQLHVSFAISKATWILRIAVPRIHNQYLEDTTMRVIIIVLSQSLLFRTTPLFKILSAVPDNMADTHSIITPAIMYWGTPVALITTSNEDGTANIGPISSVWWLGHRCVLGLASGSQTTINLFRTKQCVINLPSNDMAHYINPIAKTTGTPTVPPGKKDRGYKHCKDKFSASGLTQQASDFVQPPRIAECPVQMEAEVTNSMELMQDVPDRRGILVAIEVKVLRTHVRNDLRMDGYADRIDPDRWRPLIMSFQEFYGLMPTKVAESNLATIDEEKYRVVTRSDVVKQGGDMDTLDSEAGAGR